MNHTERVIAGIRILPFRSGLSRRLRLHLDRCPECLGRMADIQESRSVTVSRHDLGKSEDFWPRFAPRLDRPLSGEYPGPMPAWRWAMGMAGLLALAIMGVFFFIPKPATDILSSGVKFRVNYVRMYEEPAQAFVFHTQDANSTFVWVEKSKSGEII
jgi:hypothetical protein